MNKYFQPRVAASLLAIAILSGAATLHAQEILVDGFEGASGTIHSSNASAQIVTSGKATQGKRVLDVHLSAHDEDSITIPVSRPVGADSLGDSNLAFDVTNLSQVSVQIFVSLRAADGRSRQGMGVVGPGETKTMYAVLSGYEANVETGMREIPPAWKTSDTKLFGRNYLGTIDPTQLTSITFETHANPSAREILIDNIRLRKNPPADPFFLTDLVDRYGQAAKLEYPLKVHSDAELLAAAKKELAELAASKGPPGRSRFGGWANGPKLKATGYFRTEKVKGKWWLVDPDGYLFFSSGVANVRMANLGTMTGYDFSAPDVRKTDPEALTPEDSIDIVPVAPQYRESRFLASPLRRSMFEWLPAYDDPLGDAYGYRRSAHRGAMEHGEIYSFYKANLERRYGADYMAKWREVTIERMRDWGMTSFGNWVDPKFYQSDRIPYFANGWIIGDYKTLSTGEDVWSPMPDVYDPEFKRRARLTVEEIAREVQGSPWCVGVFVDNEKSWGRNDNLQTHYGLILDALSKSSKDSPAKAHFTVMLKQRYKSVAALNAKWKTHFASWDAFAVGAKLTDLEAAREDLSLMLSDYGETYFATVSSELKRVMPHHLYMGVRMAQWGMPEEIIRAALKHSDVLSFNNYKEVMHPEAWGFLAKLDKPTIIGEFHIGSTSDTGLYHPGIVEATDQKDRARMYEQYMNSVIDNPVMVGAHWFQYVDDNVTGRAYDGENYNVGWVTNTDRPYPEMVEAAKRVNYGLYQRRYGK
ncbi:agarase [Tsuneonella mangrovi]|uniref:agarase n=1 Tax=Tsuneonella mangrovi TaxID=1982042 RepID=UPI000BA20453|nr:agarase [Tsuneonella mangrovi]